MARVRKRGEEIRMFIVDLVAQHPTDIVRVAADKFGITRQAAHKHVARLVDEQFLVVDGATKSRRYRLAVFETWTQSYDIRGLQEDQVWRNDVEPRLGGLPDNARKIWAYGFTEMLNNAIDHSTGASVKRGALMRRCPPPKRAARRRPALGSSRTRRSAPR